jgi:hypothetical protein
VVTVARDVTTEWVEIISDEDSGWYTLDIQGGDVRVAVGDQPTQPSAGIVARAADTIPVNATDLDSVYARAESGTATVNVATGRVERQPRREVERPQDASARTGSTIEAQGTVTPGANGGTDGATIYDNTTDEDKFVELVTGSLVGNFYVDNAEWLVDVDVVRGTDAGSQQLAEVDPANMVVPFEPAVRIEPGQTLKVQTSNHASSMQQLDVTAFIRP